MMTFRESRPTISNPFGKCTAEIRTIVPEIVADKLTVYAADTGRTKQEAHRSIVELALMGAGRVLSARLGVYAPDDPPLEFEQVVSALAMANRMSRDQYIQKVLHEHVYGLGSSTVPVSATESDGARQ
jgi:hypothetical protein